MVAAHLWPHLAVADEPELDAHESCAPDDELWAPLLALWRDLLDVYAADLEDEHLDRILAAFGALMAADPDPALDLLAELE